MSRSVVALISLLAAGVTATGVLVAFTARGAAPAPAAVSIEPAASPSPGAHGLPATWIAGLHQNQGGRTLLISCLDTNGDARLDAGDGAEFADLDASFVPGKECVDPALHADFFEGAPRDAASYSCDAAHAPLLVVAVGGGGTDLLIASSGVSLGILDIVNDLEARATGAGIATAPLLAAGAVYDSDYPQTRMEQWIMHEVSARLDAMPCLRAVLIGHSHGGVIVSSAMAALEQRYASRLFGVMIDRSIALYDRPATEMPQHVPMLNVFQLNEGWHGEPIDGPNITNADASWETAPADPRAGDETLATVSHLTLDDSPGVQRAIVDNIMAWAQ